MILPDDASAPMRYGILGNDESTTAEKLAKYTGVVSWAYLKPHCEKETLLYVDPSLALEDVGGAFAANDTAKVEAWMKSGDIVRMGELHAAQWEKAPETEFLALVVTPFVLCRPVTS